MSFDPEITGPCGCEEYYDGTVIGDVTASEDAITIHTFSSHAKGGGRRALQWMKQKYKHICVDDPGRPDSSPDSFAFWKKMAEENLIFQMIDPDGMVIYQNGRWTIPGHLEDQYAPGFLPPA